MGITQAVKRCRVQSKQKEIENEKSIQSIGFESFVGIWRITDPGTGGWPTIVIKSSEDGTLLANFRYACELPVYWSFPTDCDGGSVSARYSGNPVLMLSDHGEATYSYTFSLNSDTLHVMTFIHYTDNSVGSDSISESEFLKQAYSFPDSEQIVFYQFFAGPPHDHVLAVVHTTRFLVAALADEPYTSDTAADLRAALELVLQDEWNGWESSDLEIVAVTFRNSHADIILQGEYSGESDEVLSAASMQILQRRL